MSELKTEWELDKYFYSGIKDVRIKQDLQTYKDKIEKFILDYEGKIYEFTEVDFLKYLEDTESLHYEAEKISTYLFFLSSLDTQNQPIQKEITKLEKIFSDCNEKLLFVDEEYKQIGFRNLMYMSDLDIMNPFKNYVRSIAIDLQYLLDKSEEKIYLKLSTASSSNVFEELTSSFEFNFRGKIKTQDDIWSLRENTDRSIRIDAWKSISDVYKNKQNQIVLSNLYSLVCKDNVADIELRNYKTVISERNISEELSDETVDFLMTTIQKNYSLYHKFLSVKAKILGLDKLETYDITASYPTNTNEKKFTFEEGWNLYRKTIEKIDPKLAVFSDDMLNNGRISVYPKLGKSSGAYAMYSKKLPEFVLLNWTDTTNDISTLAHELGHAFHGNLSKIQKDAVYDTPLTLAETASIFNETLMFETLIDLIEDKEEKKKLIFNRLDDIFGTIFRQVAYVCFEKRCHESFKNNEPLTYDDYNNIWIEEMKRLMGDGVNVDPELLKYSWSSIPHIFETPFYCYTYAFGNIISLNIYQNYKDSENKEKFIEKYHALLASGGSDTPENLLNDILEIKFDDNFYQVAFKNIDDLIKKLEE